MRLVISAATAGPAPSVAPRRPRRAFALALAACAACAAPHAGAAATADSDAPWLPGDPTHTLVVPLAGEWDCWLDPEAIGRKDRWQEAISAGRAPETAPSASFPLHVPGPIEATDATRQYDGVFWLARDVDLPAPAARAGLALRLGQVNDYCEVWWDGAPVGSHAGGYEPVELHLPGAPGHHRLVLMVLDTGATETWGRTLRTVPHSKEDWYENFGGVLGPVSLELRLGWTASELRVRPDAATGRVDLSLRLAPPRAGAPPTPARCEVLREGQPVASAALPDGATPSATLDVPEPKLWSPESPALYVLRVLVGDEVVATQSFGFRRFELRDDQVFLNGARRVLKGVLWQPHFTGTGGMVPSDAELAADAAAIKAAGFDLVRAHVRPAPPAFLDACDALGLMVLEEPAIGWVDDSPALEPLLVHEVEWMVRRDRDRACVVMWGLLNELSGHAFLHADALEAAAHALDGTRPILRDSGGFFGARWRPPGADAEAPMTDAHLYPPWPLPPERRDELAALGTGAQGPCFASEYGYGGSLDAARASEGFRSRGVRDEEAGLYRSFARLAQRAHDDPATWAQLAPGGDWMPAMQQQQADALTDMTDALRGGGALDLLCLTQWRAASSESSAGLLEPWGEPRPALGAMHAALQPLRVVVQPELPSFAAGAPVRVRVLVINDAALPAEGEVSLSAQLLPGGAGSAQSCPLIALPGVSGCSLQLPAPAGAAGGGALGLQASFGPPDGPRASSASVRVQLVPAPALAADVAAAAGELPRPLVWAPEDEPEARAFLAARGLLCEDPHRAAVALLPHAERIASLPLVDAYTLWSLVLRGGAAVVLLQDPGAGELGRLTGAARGATTVAGLPRPVAIAPAAGNFNARFHALRDGEHARLLGRGDESVSPVAMVTGEPPEDSEARLVTLGFLGNRLGAPWIEEPFGAGRLVLVGLPLLDPVRGGRDPLREAWLMDALNQALRTALLQAPARRAAWEAAAGRRLPVARTLGTVPADALAPLFAQLDALVALGDRAGTALGSPEALPDGWRALPERRQAAWTALLLGDVDVAEQTLRAALAPLATDELRAFQEAEGRVLSALAARAAQGPAGWPSAWDGAAAWGQALAAWFGGRPDEAQADLARATAALR